MAEEQLVHESVRRLEAGLRFPAQSSVPGWTPNLMVDPWVFTQEPIKDLSVDRTNSEVLRDFRGEERRTEIFTVFSPETQAENP